MLFGDTLEAPGMMASISLVKPMTTKSTGQLLPIPQAGKYCPTRNRTPSVMRMIGPIRLRGLRARSLEPGAWS